MFQSDCQTLWEALVRNPMILKDPAALDFNWCTVLKIKKKNYPNAAIKFYDVYQISRKQYEFKTFVCFNNFTFQIWKINYTNAPRWGGGVCILETIYYFFLFIKMNMNLSWTTPPHHLGGQVHIYQRYSHTENNNKEDTLRVFKISHWPTALQFYVTCYKKILMSSWYN